MVGFNTFLALQVGNSSGDLKDAGISPGGEAQFVYGHLDELIGVNIQLAELL